MRHALTSNATQPYARDNAHKDELMKCELAGRSKVEVSGFKGLGETAALVE
jgi:topoisomerase-4 subunit B